MGRLAAGQSDRHGGSSSEKADLIGYVGQQWLHMHMALLNQQWSACADLQGVGAALPDNELQEFKAYVMQAAQPCTLPATPATLATACGLSCNTCLCRCTSSP